MWEDSGEFFYYGGDNKRTNGLYYFLEGQTEKYKLHKIRCLPGHIYVEDYVTMAAEVCPNNWTVT